MPSIHTVVFDLGGVLIEWNPEKILAALYPDAEIRAAVRRDIFQHPEWLDFDRGRFDESGAAERFQRRTGRPLAEMTELLRTTRASLVPIEETVACLESLHARGVPLYCLSNMPAATFAELRGRHGFFSRFRGCVVSGEIGLMKPEREIFEYLLGRYDLDPGGCVFIDDHEPNVVAARAAGIHAFRFTGAEDCRTRLDALLRG